MRILYHHRVGSKDGQAVHLEELVGALRALGNAVAIVGPKSFAQASFGHEPVAISTLKAFVPKPAYEILELLYNLVAYARLRSAWRRFHPDIIYERYNLFLLAGIWLKKAKGIPLVLEVNAPLASERAEHGGLGLRKLAEFCERWVWKKADYVLPVTQVLAQRVLAAGVSPEKIIVISNAINAAQLEADQPRTPLQLPVAMKNKVILGFTGFVRDWHGLDSIIDLISLPEASAIALLIVGEGPALPALKARAERLNVSDRVQFAGLVGREEIGKYIAAFDIALQPKCVDYCSPLKLFEYMAFKKAIVAPDQPNIREVLVPGKSGQLFDTGRPETLADAIMLLAADVSLREKLGAGAAEAIRQNGYTWENNAKRVTALGEKAISADRVKTLAVANPAIS